MLTRLSVRGSCEIYTGISFVHVPTSLSHIKKQLIVGGSSCFINNLRQRLNFFAELVCELVKLALSQLRKGCDEYGGSGNLLSRC